MRLNTAIFLIFVASKISPKRMQPVFAVYIKMLKGFLAETEKGRTFGVVIVPWGDSQPDLLKATLMQACAFEAARLFRERSNVTATDDAAR